MKRSEGRIGPVEAIVTVNRTIAPRATRGAKAQIIASPGDMRLEALATSFGGRGLE